MMEQDSRCLNVGFGNSIPMRRILTVMRAESAPLKRLRQRAAEEGRLVDLTEGRKTRSLILLDSNHVVLSATQVETLVARLEEKDLNSEGEDAEEWEEDRPV